MVKKVFISYKWEDKASRNGLEGAMKNTNNNFDAISDSERKDLRSKGEKEIKEYLKEKIRKSNAVICLVGQDTHSSEMVQWELEVSNSLGKKIIPVRIPNTTGGAPKPIRNKDLLNWNIDDINNALL